MVYSKCVTPVGECLRLQLFYAGTVSKPHASVYPPFSGTDLSWTDHHDTIDLFSLHVNY